MANGNGNFSPMEW